MAPGMVLCLVPEIVHIVSEAFDVESVGPQLLEPYEQLAGHHVVVRVGRVP